MQIKAGDIVTLKAGGPELTVESIGTYNGIPKAVCSWFVDGEFRTQVIAVEALTT